MTIPQIIMACWFITVTLSQLVAMWMDKSGRDCTIRFIVAAIVEIGPVAVALYLAGFWA